MARDMSVLHPIANPERRSWRADVVRRAFPLLALLASAVAILAATCVAWIGWRMLPGADAGRLDVHLRFGLAAAILAGVLAVLRGEHRLGFYLADEKAGRTASLWNLAFGLVLTIAFLTRRVDELSRGVVVLHWAVGFLMLWGARSAVARALRIASKLKLLAAQRLLVVGTEPAIGTFLRRHQPWNLGYEVVGTIAVGSAVPDGRSAPSPELQRAVERMRSLDIDDVYIAVPWSDAATIDMCVEAFVNLPTSLHLAPERVLERFDQVAIERTGGMASLELTRPMPELAVAGKRAFDLVAATAALVLLSPILALAALAIKLDSRGPVFFLQTRYGFNHRPFRIVKLRTMSSFRDTEDVPQAVANDPRITRVGALLRATNLDELPQLFNVLLGQMSLVGPRPHAVPHNRAYERRIARYARRHNVRPGITGWAQVNGLRGETDTDEKMRRRVEFDLYYIDNWSPLLDLRILVETVFSARAYRNAR